MLRAAHLSLALLVAIAACKPVTPEHEPLAPGQEALDAAQARSAIQAAPRPAGARSGTCTGVGCEAARSPQVELAESFTQALESTDDAPALQEAQRRWAARKLACREAADPEACLREADRNRIAELREIDADAPRLVEYTCQGSDLPFTARFRDGDPPTAVFMLGGDRAEVPVATSGSGARYAGDGVEYWEHQGEATVDFHGTQLTCKPLG